MAIDWSRLSVELVGVTALGEIPLAGRSAGLYDHHLWFIERGRATVTVEGTEHAAGRGDVLVLQPQVVAGSWWDRSRPFRIIVIRFRCLDRPGGRQAALVPALPVSARDLDRRFSAACVSRIAANATGAWRLGTAFPRGERIRCETLLTALLMEIELAAAPASDRTPPTAADARAESLRRLAQRISADPANQPSVRAMADALHLSVSQFSLLFKRYASLSPRRFIVVWRIRHACRLMLESDRPIKSIAESLGYRDVFFFSRQFKQVTGCSPAAYRLQQGRGDAS
jgi:AraC family transcriptional regulator of arabinose operon